MLSHYTLSSDYGKLKVLLDEGKVIIADIDAGYNKRMLCKCYRGTMGEDKVMYICEVLDFVFESYDYYGEDWDCFHRELKTKKLRYIVPNKGEENE